MPGGPDIFKRILKLSAGTIPCQRRSQGSPGLCGRNHDSGLPENKPGHERKRSNDSACERHDVLCHRDHLVMLQYAIRARGCELAHKACAIQIGMRAKPVASSLPTPPEGCLLRMRDEGASLSEDLERPDSHRFLAEDPSFASINRVSRHFPLGQVPKTTLFRGIQYSLRVRLPGLPLD